MHSSNYTHGFGWISLVPDHKSHLLHECPFQLQLHFLFYLKSRKTSRVRIPLFRSDVHDLSESSSDVPATCSGTSNTQQSNTTLNPKEDFKEALLLMSLRANRVYRHAQGSQVSFKHQTDLKVLHNCQEKTSL